MLLLNGKMELNATNVLLTLGILSLVFFPSALGLTLVAGIAIAELKESLNFWSLLKALFTLFLLFLPFLYTKVKIFFNRGSIFKYRRNLFLVFFYIFVVLMSISLLYHGNFPVDREISNLTWQKFQKFCGGGPDFMDNLIQRQIQCSELKGTVVSWKAQVQNVKISQIDNSLDTLFDYLPNSLAQWLRSVK